LTKQLGFENPNDLIEAIEAMHEENPMLGLRGCRLGIVRDGLTEMQVEAIMNAAADLMERDPVNGKPRPRIMIPLVGSVKEFEQQALIIKATAKKVIARRKVNVPYEIGTMIEVPRAAIVSNKIAALLDEDDGKRLCQFFSYGTNDLTQMTMGISRDDAGSFIPQYLDMAILPEEPFKTIDEDGVGWLVQLSAAKGRTANPNLSLSVCGEHGGDPESIKFFDRVGMDYVSCSPFRVPVARLAKAQAAILRQRKSRVEKKERVFNFVDRSMLGFM
jgi:pyruvate,orthophosphate dikinase